MIISHVRWFQNAINDNAKDMEETEKGETMYIVVRLSADTRKIAWFTKHVRREKFLWEALTRVVRRPIRR